ncbi:MAG: 3-carboxy-cis,cis-muconate cycloisomerase [Alphaproteobacteria bacterium]|nr:3-carboxy-cis,cis-muconate cycloisomerase [Alphaproteobacteria bacterium]
MPRLHARLFGDPAVDDALSDDARLQAMLDVELALAEAAFELGLAPEAALPAIRAAAKASLYDHVVLADEAAKAGNLAIPLVRMMTRKVAETDASASDFVHLGATSQDIIDTGLVLQLRRAVPLIMAHLDRAATAAADHARRHALTPMAGRTWMQQAVPITFGLKAAGWFEALSRVNARIAADLVAAAVLQFGGASGTLASLGGDGVELAEALGRRLGLPVPDLPWHAHRDRLVALGASLGIAAGTLGKLARDLALLGQTEIGEAYEAPTSDRGGSSTMPHKRNPVLASVALAAAERAPGLVATLLGAMGQEHERGLGGWQAEWETLPELVRVVAGSARSMADALSGLVVDPERMRANLQATGGLVLAEAVSATLGSRIGKARAHGLVEAACRRAIEERRPLASVLAAEAEISRYLSADEIEFLMMPDSYLGASAEFVDRVLSKETGNG